MKRQRHTRLRWLTMLGIDIYLMAYTAACMQPAAVSPTPTVLLPRARIWFPRTSQTRVFVVPMSTYIAQSSSLFMRTL